MFFILGRNESWIALFWVVRDLGESADSISFILLRCQTFGGSRPAEYQSMEAMVVTEASPY